MDKNPLEGALNEDQNAPSKQELQERFAFEQLLNRLIDFDKSETSAAGLRSILNDDLTKAINNVQNKSLSMKPLAKALGKAGPVKSHVEENLIAYREFATLLSEVCLKKVIGERKEEVVEFWLITYYTCIEIRYRLDQNRKELKSSPAESRSGKIASLLKKGGAVLFAVNQLGKLYNDSFLDIPFIAYCWEHLQDFWDNDVLE